MLDNLDANGLIITKRGKPVARVIPYQAQDSDLIAIMNRKIKIKGDIFTTGHPMATQMVNLDTHILIFAFNGELQASVQRLSGE